MVVFYAFGLYDIVESICYELMAVKLGKPDWFVCFFVVQLDSVHLVGALANALIHEWKQLEVRLF